MERVVPSIPTAGQRQAAQLGATHPEPRDPWSLLEAARRELHELRAAVAEGQRLANLGDYVWNLAPDTAYWSEHLHRILGVDPATTTPSYQGFMDLLHPEDRDRIGEVHRAALESGTQFQAATRIVRPDGEVRHLQTSGQVICDPSGVPVRVRGICFDVTERVLADRARAASAAQFRDLVEAGPEAVLVVEGGGRVTLANRRAAALLGHDPVGSDQTQFLRKVTPGSSARGMTALDMAGRPLHLDVDTAELRSSDVELVAIFLRDAQDRLDGERVAAQLREAQVRRTQALELNDNVAQALTTVGQLVERGDTVRAMVLLEQTLTAARRLMTDWMTLDEDDRLTPGDLVRTTPSRRPRVPVASPAQLSTQGPAAARTRVLVVDDDVDLRALFVLQVAEADDMEVVGEAGDGEEAVALAEALQPDVVLLDMAMPVMDGLQALPLIVEEVPGVRVIVVSSFGEESLGPQALELGAVRYLEKGLRMELVETVRSASR